MRRIPTTKAVHSDGIGIIGKDVDRLDEGPGLDRASLTSGVRPDEQGAK